VGASGDDELDPAQLEALYGQVLAHQAGIDPNVLGEVLDLAAVGLVNSAWRNSPVEDWHAGRGSLSDGDMLRINSHTTWRVREIIRRWRREIGLAPYDLATTVDDIDVMHVNTIAYRVFRWLTTPTRRLPTGQTLRAIAGDELDEFVDHVDRSLGGFAAQADRRSVRIAFWSAAAHGGLACRDWWGTPGWPLLVNRFLEALDNPHHARWGEGGKYRDMLAPEPAGVADRAALRRNLLRHPWELDADTAQWLTNAAIGHLQDTVPPLPEPRPGS
jgi:hypothetical protein